MTMKHWRLLGYVCTFAFLWVTVEIVRADPERRMMVVWMLLGAGVVAVCIGIHRSTRAHERQRDERDVVATIDRIRPVD